MVVFGIVLAIVALAVTISWWSEGYIGATEGIVLFVVYGSLLVGLFGSETTLVRLFAIVPLLATVILGAWHLRSGSLRSYHRQKVRQYESAIDFDPHNFAARTKLAQTLYELGELGRAIAEMQIAVGSNPTAALTERHTLSHWQQEERLKRTGSGFCPRCGRDYERGPKECAKCGTRLQYQFDARYVLRRNVRQFAVMTIGLGLAGVLLTFLPLRVAAVPAVCALLAAIGWNILRDR